MHLSSDPHGLIDVELVAMLSIYLQMQMDVRFLVMVQASFYFFHLGRFLSSSSVTKMCRLYSCFEDLQISLRRL